MQVPFYFVIFQTGDIKTVALIRKEASEKQLAELIEWLETMNLRVHVSKGMNQTAIGLVGDTSNIDTELLESLSIVESVTRLSEKFKSANRKFHPDDTVVSAGDVKIGGGNFAVFAGPCSVAPPRADRIHRRQRKSIRRERSPRRCVQAENISLRLSGT